MIDTWRLRARREAVEGNYPVHVKCFSEVDPEQEGQFGHFCHGCEKNVPVGEVVRPWVDRDTYLEDLGQAIARIDELVNIFCLLLVSR